MNSQHNFFELGPSGFSNMTTTGSGFSPALASSRDRNSMSMTPHPGAQFDGNTGFNTSSRVERYQPPQRRGQTSLNPIVRPESSASNINSNFGSQAPYQSSYFTDPWQQSNRGGRDYGMNSLGAGLSNLRLGNTGAQYSSSSYPNGNGNSSMTRRDSKVSNTSSDRTSKPPSRSSSKTPASTPTARYLADVIKSGATEDPSDRTLSRYDTPAKMAVPSLGPARFNESKMFSTTSAQPSMPEASINSSAPVLRQLEPRAVPEWLAKARRGYKPSVSEATASIPFFELCRGVSPPTTGMIRIKDIPYGTSRAEIIAFVGRNAQIARLPEGSPYHAVHIMMERESGKTMDCFVEFSTPGEAAWVTRQFTKRVEQGRPPKVGDRVVEVAYASQDEFMSELFPRAKHTHWNNGQPIVDTSVRQYYSGQNAEGFKGFVHPEEYNQLKKHAGLSDRSPFASKSPCRVYEHMITTLLKFPWYAVNRITVRERTALYDCTLALLRILIEGLRRSSNKYSPLEPTQALLQEFVVAALSCPGFSEKQKNFIVQRLYQYNFKNIAEGSHTNVKLGGHFEYSGCWPFEVLAPVPGTDSSLIKFYARLFRDATSSPQSQSLATRMAQEVSGRDQDPMGKISPDYGRSVKDLTLAQAATAEWAEVERLIKRACSSSAASTPSSGSGGSNNYTFNAAPGSSRRTSTRDGSSSSGSTRNGAQKPPFDVFW